MLTLMCWLKGFLAAVAIGFTWLGCFVVGAALFVGIIWMIIKLVQRTLPSVCNYIGNVVNSSIFWHVLYWAFWTAIIGIVGLAAINAAKAKVCSVGFEQAYKTSVPWNVK